MNEQQTTNRERAGLDDPRALDVLKTGHLSLLPAVTQFRDEHHSSAI
jgi:hypothetical protein